MSARFKLSFWRRMSMLADDVEAPEGRSGKNKDETRAGHASTIRLVRLTLKSFHSSQSSVIRLNDDRTASTS
jgi:hypothetical protein